MIPGRIDTVARAIEHLPGAESLPGTARSARRAPRRGQTAGERVCRRSISSRRPSTAEGASRISDAVIAGRSIEDIRATLYSAVIADALDAHGMREPCPDVELAPLTGVNRLAGRCRPTQWEDVEGEDPAPYALELEAVDDCRPGDVLVCAAGGSRRSGIWGELLSTAASNRGCLGAVVDGAVRDVEAMTRMGFPVFAASARPLDSLHRQRVVARDEPVVLGGVRIECGDFLFADRDGVVVVPAAEAERVIAAAWEKVVAENEVRDAIRDGMGATETFEKYGVL